MTVYSWPDDVCPEAHMCENKNFPGISVSFIRLLQARNCQLTIARHRSFRCLLFTSVKTRVAGSFLRTSETPCASHID